MTTQRFLLGGKPITIEPRRKWMGDTVFSESTKMGHVNEQGLALAYYGGEGWGKLVRDGKYHDGAFSDELVEAAAALIEREWGELLRQRPWLTFVPSLRHPRLVPDYAARLAKRLNLPCIEAVRCTVAVPEQKTMQNSYQQLANIQQAFALLPFAERGPVILVDDMLDSGWTMTVIGWLLREHGASAVYPFALAKATPSD